MKFQARVFLVTVIPLLFILFYNILGVVSNAACFPLTDTAVLYTTLLKKPETVKAEFLESLLQENWV